MAVVSQEAASSAETGAETAPQLQLGGFVAPQSGIGAYYASAETTTTSGSHNIDDEDADSNEDEGEQTFWDMLATWYLPLILLWLRRSMFGIANMIRTLLVGQAIRLLLLTQSGDMPKWAQPFTDPHAWPPPAFTALAIFTVVAFVVHPDGLTWFMLGKLRDAILSLLHSFASCWTMFIQDYGIITTTIALMTLAGIGCLLGILLKNALPSKGSSKRNYSSHADGKKKKKRKGVKGKGSRIRQFRKQPLQAGVAEKVPDAKPVGDESSSATALHESTRVCDPTIMLEGSSTFQEEVNTRSATFASASTILMEETIPESEPLLESAAPSVFDRPRMQSTDTAETMTDDLSCDSTSVRSFSSTPTAVTVGSTANSEKSGPNSKRRNNNTANSRRKQQQNSAGSSKPPRGDRKVAPSVDSNHESKTSYRQNQNNSAANKPAPSNRHPPDGSRQSTKSAPSGRFANLKEKDTRFDNPRARNNNARVGGGGGVNIRGRNNVHHGRNSSNNRNAIQHHQPADSYGSAATPTIPVKHAPALIAHSPLRSAPTNQHHCGSSVQYGSPYSPDVSSQKKQDLSSFIATVGLVGSEASALVANVADIDSLNRLSDIQFQLYGVGVEKQAQLAKLLEQRRRRRRPVAVRPPPGLSPIHDEPPTLFGSPNRPPINLTPQVSYINPVASHFHGATSHPFAYDEYQQRFMVDDEDSRIEAELQELGGKMIGSVLDF